MSEIQINIIDETHTISGRLHGSFGDLLVAALTAEPATIAELETALERFFKRESDWSLFRHFDRRENFEPYDAGLLVIDLAARAIMADSTYSYYSKEGTVRIKTVEGDDLHLPYELSDDWTHVRSLPELEYRQTKARVEKLKHPAFDARTILGGKPLFEFIARECAAHAASADEARFPEIHAKWLMTPREDLHGRTPREILLEKQDFIGSDLHSRSLQWSFTKICPPPLSVDSNAYRFAGFGTDEIVVYYELFRYLLAESFARKNTDPEYLEKSAAVWLSRPQPDFSGRTPAKIIEAERRRVNLTMSAHECLIDEDCETCQNIAAEFDTPMFWHLDGAGMDDDRFEFSFFRTREEWEEDRQRLAEFDRRFAAGEFRRDDFFDDELIA